jgi:hypothetical protein
LLAACERFRELNARNTAIFHTPGLSDNEKDAAVDALEPEWELALEALCAARATTLKGIVARGVALAEYMPEKASSDFTGCWDEMQVNALLRDLVAMNA